MGTIEIAVIMRKNKVVQIFTRQETASDEFDLGVTVYDLNSEDGFLDRFPAKVFKQFEDTSIWHNTEDVYDPMVGHTGKDVHVAVLIHHGVYKGIYTDSNLAVVTCFSLDEDPSVLDAFHVVTGWKEFPVAFYWDETRPEKLSLLNMAEALGWEWTEDPEDGSIEFRQCSPAGEDYHFCVAGEDLAREVFCVAADFNVHEHVSMWLEASSGRPDLNIPDVETLVDDARDIQKMLDELDDAFNDRSSLADMQERKKIWLRLGVSMEIAAADLEKIQCGQGEKILKNLIANGDFTVEGESYIPPNHNPADNEWRIEEEINLEF